MSIKKAILTCDKLILYSPDYKIKIVKYGQEGIVIDNGLIKVFCISHDRTTFSYRVNDTDFVYIYGNIDKIKNYVFDNDKKLDLYLLIVAVKSNINIVSKKILYSKIIHNICASEYYKSNSLPIPCGEYNFCELIEEWYNNEDVFEEEELLIKVLQVILYRCKVDNININKLFV